MSSIELKAINVVTNIFLDCEQLYPSFTSEDKIPLVDGEIRVYDNGNRKNENLIGRFNVQIKGKTVKNLNTCPTAFPLPLNDLKALMKSGGALLLVVMMQKDNRKLTSTYFAYLFPFDIENLIRNKESQKTVNVPLKILPITPRQIMGICKLALEKQQRIKAISLSEDIMKNIKKIDITVAEEIDQSRPCWVGSKGVDAVIDITTTNGIQIPINSALQIIPAEYAYHKCNFTFDSGEVSFPNCKRRRINDHIVEIVLSPGLQFKLNIKDASAEITYTTQKNFYSAYQDIVFLHHWRTTDQILINGETVTTIVDHQSNYQELGNLYQIFHDLFSLFEILKVDPDKVLVDDLTLEVLEKLETIVRIFVYGQSPVLDSDTPVRQELRIGKQSLQLIYYINPANNRWECYSLFSLDMDLSIRWFNEDKENPQNYTITAYQLLSKEDFVRTLNLNLEQVVEIHKKQLDPANPLMQGTDTILKLLGSADSCSQFRLDFLNAAWKLNQWLETLEVTDITQEINRWQILYRLRRLKPEEQNKILNLKRSLPVDLDGWQTYELACCILLNSFEEARTCFENLPPEQKKEFTELPIYFLLEDQGTTYSNSQRQDRLS